MENEENKNINDSNNNNIIIENTDNDFNKILDCIKNNKYSLNIKNIIADIPLILNFLENDKENKSNKILIIDYLINLFKKIDFYMVIFSNFLSNNKINLKKIILKEYLLNDENEYKNKLKILLYLLIYNINFEKDDIIFLNSFLLNYINKKRNYPNYKNYFTNINNINQYNINNFIEILNIFYNIEHKKCNEPYNYFYFSGYENGIKILNKKDEKNKHKVLINFDHLCFLIFFKCYLDSNELKENFSNIEQTLLKINLKNNQKIEIKIDIENNLKSSFTNNDILYKIKSKEFNILFVKFKINGKKLDIFLYINNEKINLNYNENINNDEIIEINFFKNFFGICSNIIIFRQIKDIFPKFLLNDKNILFPFGFYSEKLFYYLIYNEFEKNEIEIKNNVFLEDHYFLYIFKNLKDNKSYFKDFIDKIICIYTPNRYELKNNDMIIVDGNFNNLNAELFSKNINSLCGLYNYKINFIKIYDGINSILPLIEILFSDVNLISKKGIDDITFLICSIISKYYKINNIKIMKHFFCCFSIFLEKLSIEYFNEDLVGNLKSIFLLINNIEIENKIKYLTNEFLIYIIFNEKILFKFSNDEQRNLLNQETLFENSNLKLIKFEQIISILLYYDKEKYKKMCCKEHSEYFKDKNSEIMNPPLNEKLKNLNRLISHLLINNNHSINIYFRLLTYDISPCLKYFIINTFIDHFKVIKSNNNNSYDILKRKENFKSLNNEDSEFIKVCLFILSTSLIDARICIIKLLLYMIERDLSDDEYYFIENNIIPNYFLLNYNNEKNYNDKKDIIKYKNKTFHLIKLNENELKLYSNFNEKLFNQHTNTIYSCLHFLLSEEISLKYTTKLLLKIIPKTDINIINKFLTTINYILKEQKFIKIVLEINFFHFLLDTSFQFFLLQNTNDFKSSFILNNNEDNKVIINDSYDVSVNIIYNLLDMNIYFFDFFISWGKYYNILFFNNEKCKKLIQEFINNFFNKIIAKNLLYNDFSYDNCLNNFKNLSYLINIYFEFLTSFLFNSLDLNEMTENNNDEILIKKLLLFIKKIETTFFFDINIENGFPELKAWKHYKNLDYLFKIISLLIPNYEIKNIKSYLDSNKNIINIKILYGILFNTFSSQKMLISNKIPLILIIFLFFYLILIKIEKEEDIIEWTNYFEKFIIFLLVSSLNYNIINEELNSNSLIETIIYLSYKLLLRNIKLKKSEYYYKTLCNILHFNLGLYKEIKVKENEANNSKFMKKSSDINNLKNSTAYHLFDDLMIFKRKLLTVKDNLYINLNKSGDKINVIKNFLNINKDFEDYFMDDFYYKKYIKNFKSFIDVLENRKNNLKFIIPFYNNSLIVDIKNFENEDICLLSDYIINNTYNKILISSINKLNLNLREEIKIYHYKQKYNNYYKMKIYKKIKKKLFSFNNIWSTQEYFYEPDKYILKYKLVNFVNSDLTKILLKPIFNIDYYLPEFSLYNNQNIFFKNNEEKLFIKQIIDFSFEEKKDKIKNIFKNKVPSLYDNSINIETNNEFNILFYLNYQYFNFISKIDKNDFNTKCFKKYINNLKFNNNLKIEPDINENINESCLIKLQFHIKGMFYINQNEIGFYAYNIYKNEKNEDFDTERESCFGSIFKNKENIIPYYFIKIPFYKIKYVFKRRYFYRRNCIEVFTIKNKSYLFKFDNEKKTNKILENLTKKLNIEKYTIEIENNDFGKKIGYYNKNCIIPLKYDNYNLSEIYKKWKNWEISNLHFIMILNIFGNRSYNDLNQYPIFPWIITDYSSDNLNTANFYDNMKELPPFLIRQFNSPMAMLDFNKESKERKEKFLKSWENEDDDDSTFDNNLGRYRSHYSNSLYVTYYLVRIIPFCFSRIEIQGKNFDDPNRLFNDMFNSFLLSSSQKTDLRELIPEIFCVPELFYNNNNLNLGEILNEQNQKERIMDVKMPKWCILEKKDLGYNFIKKYREILESPKISENINLWFDIIFGSKQKGEEAKKIHNLFIKESYENFEEEFEKSNDKLYESRLIEFGVTPNKIFKSNCERKKLENIVKLDNQLTINYINFETKAINLLKIQTLNYYSFIDFSYEKDKKKLYLNNGQEIFFCKIKQNYNNNNELDYILEPESKVINLLNLNSLVSKDIKNFTYILFDKFNYIAFGNLYAGQIIIQKIKQKKDKKDKTYNIKIILEEEDLSPVVKLIIDEDENFVFSGRKSGRIFIYKLNGDELNKIKEKIIWEKYYVLYDHLKSITDIAYNNRLNVLVSTSLDGLCHIYTFPIINLINSFKISDNIYANNIFISSSPLPSIIFYIESNKEFLIYSINGKKIYNKKYNENDIIDNIKIFKDAFFRDFIIVSHVKKIYKENDENYLHIYPLPFLDEDIFDNQAKFRNKIINFDISNDKTELFILIKNENEGKDTSQIFILNNILFKAHNKI